MIEINIPLKNSDVQKPLTELIKETMEELEMKCNTRMDDLKLKEYKSSGGALSLKYDVFLSDAETDPLSPPYDPRSDFQEGGEPTEDMDILD